MSYPVQIKVNKEIGNVLVGVPLGESLRVSDFMVEYQSIIYNQKVWEGIDIDDIESQLIAAMVNKHGEFY